MDGYTKLHAKILSSSIWDAPSHVRVLWITMLAMADQDGNLEASISGLAAFARLSKDEVREALEVLMGPDPDSTDGTDGIRVTNPTSGVYHILNHGHYRERQTRRQALDAARKRRERAEANADASALSQDSVCVYVSASGSSSVEEAFQEWYGQYPVKKAKAAALRAWKKLKPEFRKAALEDIPSRAKRWQELLSARQMDKQFIPHPATFLNGGCWEDEAPEPRTNGKQTKGQLPADQDQGWVIDNNNTDVVEEW